MIFNRWSTLHIEPKRRAEFWREAGQKAKTPVTPNVPWPDDFEATLTTRGFEELALNHVQVCSPHDVECTASDLARLERPFLFIDLYTSGKCDVLQLERGMQAAPGQPFLIDGRREYRLDHRQSVSMLALAIPIAALGPHASAVESLIARPQPQNAALHLLAGQMRMLSAWPHAFEKAESERLSDLLVGAVHAVLLGAREGELTTVRRERSFFRRKVRQVVEQMYADPALNPQVVAEKLGISVRSLHARMAQDGMTFGAELMAHRLERAHGLLRGARRGSATIGEICARCGFVSAAHFSRRFRARFGMAPSAVMADGERECAVGHAECAAEHEEPVAQPQTYSCSRPPRDPSSAEPNPG
ncbi:MAG: AraC family transcriptional regulator [Variovorax sp.]